MVYLQTFPWFWFFAANPMRHSFINTLAVGSLLSRSPRLRPASTATPRAHGDSLSDEILLGAKRFPPRLSRPGSGFSYPIFEDTGRNSPILPLRCLRCQNPTDSDMRPRRFSRIPGKPPRNCTCAIMADFPRTRDLVTCIFDR